MKASQAGQSNVTPLKEGSVGHGILFPWSSHVPFLLMHGTDPTIDFVGWDILELAFETQFFPFSPPGVNPKFKYIHSTHKGDKLILLDRSHQTNVRILDATKAILLGGG